MLTQSGASERFRERLLATCLHWYYGEQLPYKVIFHPIPMLSRRGAIGLLPCKVDVAVFKAQDNVIAIGDDASVKADLPEASVFRFDSLEVNYFQCLHICSFQKRSLDT
jgi:hypothetical protein